ncbi:hypothetical protein EJD97_009439 [Solanum chilense]|uniref:Ubiquitin-like protease family profile domain-containing protein n=1 Tax=Solanum chilense TaxID=4083 RepID=A0A6N2BN31_SOLCI|nr:hypothetical protein EJD97_009439 [Solanum chilense]
MVLAGATTIKRERAPNEVINELVAFYGTVDDDGPGVCIDDGGDVGSAAAARAGQHEGATSCRRCCGFLCDKCKKHDEDSIIILTKSLTSCFRGIGNTQDYYDPRDRILDLNFYINFLHRYNQMSDEATMSCGKSMSQLLDDFVWDDDMIDFVRGIRPTLGGMDWIDAKWILTVMNTSRNHFMNLEILLIKGLINVYDCNLVVTEHEMFFTLIQPVFELLPILLKQS